MADTIGIRFKNNAKAVFYNPDGLALTQGDIVVAETQRGLECGEAVTEIRHISDESVVKPLKKITRKATAEDLQRLEENESKRQRALPLCQERINAHGLDMKLVDAEYSFDGNKLTFYFTSDGRVDFRELLKDLASLFRTRIDLRQIGVRDEAKLLGGLGVCGRTFCCIQFLNDFQPVSIKMAKDQGLSLNPVKISGACGRLMCCLKYEQETYEELTRSTPKFGSIVNTPEGRGVVTDANILTGQLKIRLDKAPDSPPIPIHLRDVKVIRSGHSPRVLSPEQTAADEPAD